MVPVTSLHKEKNVSFFLLGKNTRNIRISNNEPVYVWVNQRLVEKVDTVSVISFSSDHYLNKDTTTITLVTKGSFHELVCELVSKGSNQIVSETLPKARQQRAGWQNFTLVGGIVILIFVSLLFASSRGNLHIMVRQTWIISKNLLQQEIKFSELAVWMVVFISALVSAYFAMYIESFLINNQNHFMDYMVLWGGYIVLALIFFLLKMLWTFISASLFDFPYKNVQFIMFNVFILSVLLPGLISFFILKSDALRWLFENIFWVVSGLLLFFNLLLLVKFVDQSKKEKLPIITYLCATEFLPSVLLLFWFFK